MAAPLNPKDLQHLLVEKDVIEWDSRNGVLKASTDLRIGSIILKSTPLPDYDRDQANQAICAAIKKEGLHLLSINDEVDQLQARVMSLKSWNEGDWPDYSDEGLLNSVDQWLAPYLNDIRKEEELEKLNITDILTHALDYDQQQRLDKLVPKRWKYPVAQTSRSSIRKTVLNPCWLFDYKNVSD